MKHSKKQKNKSNAFKDAGLRHPDNLPQSQQWRLEGDAELLAKLDGPTAIWMAAFLEAEFGNNPQVLGYDGEKSREVFNRNNANARDVMTLIPRGNSRIDLDDYTNNLVPPAQPREYPSKLEKREKLHPDLCTGGSSNPTEDSIIDALDMNVVKQQERPLTKREAAAARKARIKERLKRLPAK